MDVLMCVPTACLDVWPPKIIIEVSLSKRWESKGEQKARDGHTQGNAIFLVVCSILKF